MYKLGISWGHCKRKFHRPKISTTGESHMACKIRPGTLKVTQDIRTKGYSIVFVLDMPFAPGRQWIDELRDICNAIGVRLDSLGWKINAASTSSPRLSTAFVTLTDVNVSRGFTRERMMAILTALQRLCSASSLAPQGSRALSGLSDGGVGVWDVVLYAALFAGGVWVGKTMKG